LKLGPIIFASLITKFLKKKSMTKFAAVDETQLVSGLYVCKCVIKYHKRQFPLCLFSLRIQSTAMSQQVLKDRIFWCLLRVITFDTPVYSTMWPTVFCFRSDHYVMSWAVPPSRDAAWSVAKLRELHNNALF
jgi:hypothetical protein